MEEGFASSCAVAGAQSMPVSSSQWGRLSLYFSSLLKLCWLTLESFTTMNTITQESLWWSGEPRRTIWSTWVFGAVLKMGDFLLPGLTRGYLNIRQIFPVACSTCLQCTDVLEAGLVLLSTRYPQMALVHPILPPLHWYPLPFLWSLYLDLSWGTLNTSAYWIPPQLPKPEGDIILVWQRRAETGGGSMGVQVQETQKVRWESLELYFSDWSDSLWLISSQIAEPLWT